MLIILSILAVLYPILAYFGLKYSNPSVVSGLLIVLLILRFILDKSKLSQQKHAKLLFVTVFLLLLISLLTNSEYGILFYPVAVSLVFFSLFVYSLLFPPTVIARIALMQKESLSAYGIKYTNLVTLAWCIFFAINAGIAFYTAMYSDIETWTLYNGMISYILMGVLGSTEWLVRQKVKHKH